MTHPLVTQLWFARSEFQRVMEGVSAEDGVKRLEPMNCLSWMVGHLANQEQYYWIYFPNHPQRLLYPELDELVGFGRPATTPDWAEMWRVWEAVTAEADGYLQGLTTAVLQTHLEGNDGPRRENVGTMLQRNLLHYWFHIGEAHAVRQMLGHGELPQFVGSFGEAVYRPEGA